MNNLNCINANLNDQYIKIVHKSEKYPDHAKIYNGVYSIYCYRSFIDNDHCFQ
jgi:hypothetical protein